MFVTIINDCKCENAKIRQVTRVASLFDCSVYFSGVANDIEAAGNLVDVLDACEGREGIILVNVAPRHGGGKKWKNGTPFAYFYYKDTLVISTIGGYTLSLVKKLGITPSVRVIDIPKVLTYIKEYENISEEDIEQITNTQFRSFDYLPRVAQWVFDGYDIPYEEDHLKNVEHFRETIYWIDNFGNCKTSLLESEKKSVQFGELQLPFYKRLKDVPDGEPALVVGSSGILENRFLEVVVQGESAASFFGLQVGSKFFSDS